MHRLYVLRHAKSSWDEPWLADHDRPLAARGRRAVRAMAHHLASAGITPDLILCSTARRTRETINGVLPGAEVSYERELYEASCAGLLERLRRLPPELGSTMIVGHHPAVQELILELASGGDELTEIAHKFPTGALATLTFATAWSELAVGRAELADYVRPKALPDY